MGQSIRSFITAGSTASPSRYVSSRFHHFDMVSPEATDFRDITQKITAITPFKVIQGQHLKAPLVSKHCGTAKEPLCHSQSSVLRIIAWPPHKSLSDTNGQTHSRPVTIGHSGRGGLLCFNLLPNDILCRTKNQKLCSYRRRHEHDTAMSFCIRRKSMVLRNRTIYSDHSLNRRPWFLLCAWTLLTSVLCKKTWP